MPNQPQFSSVRSFFWPIAKSELKDFIPKVLLVFLIAGNYNALKIIKDSTVIPAAGAEIIPFIKVWLLLPMAILMTAYFGFLLTRFNQNKTFYIVISTFLSFFSVFVLFIYPHREYFYLTDLADKMFAVMPKGLSGFVSVIKYWPLSLFYTMCEIWGTMVLFVLFWGFANRTTPVKQASRFYPLLGLSGNSSGIFVPILFEWASHTQLLNSYYNSSHWEHTLFMVYLGVMLSGLTVMGIYYFINKHEPEISSKDKNNSAKPTKKTKQPFWESFKYLAQIPYVRNIAIVVLSYNIVINLTEVVWKAQIKALYPNPVDYGLYFGKVMMITGILATISDFILCSNIIRRFGWTSAALITPVILLVTSIGFFGIIIFDSIFESFLVHTFAMTPVALTTFFGSSQNALSRASKYSLFDATKEIAFIPLDAEKKTKAKAAIDGVCSRLGKSGGSVILQTFLFLFGTLTSSMTAIALTVVFILYFWTQSTLSLGKQFKKLTEQPNH